MTFGGPPDLLDGVALLALLGVLPVLAVVQARMLTPDLLASLERVPAYVSSIVALAVIAVGSAAVGARPDGAASLGLVPLPPGPLLAWTLGITLAAVGVVWLFRRVGMALGAREHPALRALLPRTPRERGVFVAVSVAAGVGEEVAYRGFALLALAPVLGPAGALAATSGVFGVLHAYQGALGMARTASMGAVLGAGLLASGSLWPPVLAHVALDLLAGLGPAERLMVPEPDSRV